MKKIPNFWNEAIFVKRLIKKLFAQFGHETGSNKGYLKREWQDNLQEEIEFWGRWLRTKGESNNTIEKFKRYSDPDTKLQDIFLEYIDKRESKNRILDVGAGPLTAVNKKCDFAAIEICAVDVLADEYDKLLRKYNIHPIVRTQMCDGERLTEKFDENTFDITCSFNALDHLHNPLKCIEEMIKVTKKERYIIISVLSREGEKAGWSGLHKWDFFVRKGLAGRHFLILEGRDLRKINITRLFRRRMKQMRLEKDGNNRTITAVYKKR